MTFQHDMPLRAPTVRRVVIRSRVNTNTYLVTTGGGGVEVAVCMSGEAFERGTGLLAQWSQASGAWVLLP